MRVVAFGGEQNLAALVRRLYQFEGRGRQARAKAAEEALLRANPHLSRLDRLAAGAPIVVPDVPGVEPTVERGATPGGILVGDIAETVKQSLGGVQAKLSASVDYQVGQAQASLDLLKSSRLKRAIKDTATEARLKEIGEQSRAQLKRIQALRAHQEQILAQLERDLDQFAERLR